VSGNGSEKQDISKYLEKETSPNPLTQNSTDGRTTASNRHGTFFFD